MIQKLRKKYSKPVAIKAAKKNDLRSLIKKELIPQRHVVFYEHLPIRTQTLDDDDEEDDYV